MGAGSRRIQKSELNEFLSFGKDSRLDNYCRHSDTKVILEKTRFQNVNEFYQIEECRNCKSTILVLL